MEERDADALKVAVREEQADAALHTAKSQFTTPPHYIHITRSIAVFFSEQVTRVQVCTQREYDVIIKERKKPSETIQLFALYGSDWSIMCHAYYPDKAALMVWWNGHDSARLTSAVMVADEEEEQGKDGYFNRGLEATIMKLVFGVGSAAAASSTALSMGLFMGALDAFLGRYIASARIRDDEDPMVEAEIFSSLFGRIYQV